MGTCSFPQWLSSMPGRFPGRVSLFTWISCKSTIACMHKKSPSLCFVYPNWCKISSINNTPSDRMLSPGGLATVWHQLRPLPMAPAVCLHTTCLHAWASCFWRSWEDFWKSWDFFRKQRGGVATFHMIWTTFTHWKKLEPQEYELKEGESTWLLKWKGQELWQFKAYRFSLEDSTTRHPKHIDRKTLLGTVFFRHIFCWSSGLYQKGRNSKPFPLSNSTS